MVKKMDCIFCKIINGEIPSKTIYEDDLVKVIMDVNPVSDGHSLIIPKKHYTDYLELDKETINHIFRVAQNIGPKMMEKLNARALTLLINYGDDQEVKHFHLHLIPDYLKSKTKKKLRDTCEIYEILK